MELCCLSLDPGIPFLLLACVGHTLQNTCRRTWPDLAQPSLLCGSPGGWSWRGGLVSSQGGLPAGRRRIQVSPPGILMWGVACSLACPPRLELVPRWHFGGAFPFLASMSQPRWEATHSSEWHLCVCLSVMEEWACCELSPPSNYSYDVCDVKLLHSPEELPFIAYPVFMSLPFFCVVCDPFSFSPSDWAWQWWHLMMMTGPGWWQTSPGQEAGVCIDDVSVCPLPCMVVIPIIPMVLLPAPSVETLQNYYYVQTPSTCIWKLVSVMTWRQSDTSFPPITSSDIGSGNVSQASVLPHLRWTLGWRRWRGRAFPGTELCIPLIPHRP